MSNIPTTDKNSNIYINITNISYNINPIISLIGNLIMFMTRQYFIACQTTVNCIVHIINIIRIV